MKMKRRRNISLLICESPYSNPVHLIYTSLIHSAFSEFSIIMAFSRTFKDIQGHTRPYHTVPYNTTSPSNHLTFIPSHPELPGASRRHPYISPRKKESVCLSHVLVGSNRTESGLFSAFGFSLFTGLFCWIHFGFLFIFLVCEGSCERCVGCVRGDQAVVAEGCGGFRYGQGEGRGCVWRSRLWLRLRLIVWI